SLDGGQLLGREVERGEVAAQGETERVERLLVLGVELHVGGARRRGDRERHDQCGDEGSHGQTPSRGVSGYYPPSSGSASAGPTSRVRACVPWREISAHGGCTVADHAVGVARRGGRP